MALPYIAVPTYRDDGVEFVKVDMYDHNDTLWYFAAFGLYRLYNVGKTSVLYDIKEAIRVSKGAWSRHNHVIRGRALTLHYPGSSHCFGMEATEENISWFVKEY